MAEVDQGRAQCGIDVVFDVEAIVDDAPARALGGVRQVGTLVEVGEDDVARVRPGQPGELMLAALPWKTLALEVRHVSPMAKAVEGRNVFEVEAEVLDPPAELRPGLSGSGRVVVGERGLATGWLADLAAASRRLWWRLWG